ncbi:unnamed protein product [Amaranthus hypochondriacus]
MSFQIQQKLKQLKSVLRYEFLHTPIQASLCQVEKQYEEAQANLHRDPYNRVLADIEQSLVEQLGKVRKDYASFIQQQAKPDWLKYGDENSTVFHNSIKQRRNHNHIRMLFVDDKVVSDALAIRQAFLSYYSNLLCSEMGNRDRLNMPMVQVGPILSEDLWPLLYFDFSADEIKNAIWDIDDNKSPSLDGFNSKFYKASWSVVGSDVVSAVRQFFSTDKLLRSWNTTTIILVPKVSCPLTQGILGLYPVAIPSTSVYQNSFVRG